MQPLTHTRARHFNSLPCNTNPGNGDAVSVPQDVETEGGEAEGEGDDGLGGLEQVLDERFVAALHALRDARMEEVLRATDGEADPPDEVRLVSAALLHRIRLCRRSLHWTACHLRRGGRILAGAWPSV